MSTTRNLFTRFTDFVTHKKTIKLTAYFSMALITNLLDAALNQKIENSSFTNYYSEAPSRIAWLILSSIALGVNLDFVIQTFQTDQFHDQQSHSNHISAKKIWVTCTTAYTGHFLIQKALSTPITHDNAVYILCDTAINGPVWGTLAAGGSYILQKLNYNILPLTSQHVLFIAMGVALSTLQEILDYICKQMTDFDSLTWDSLTSPKRLFVLHAYNALLQGVIYGISFCNLKKYSRVDPDAEGDILKIRNRLIGGITFISPISIFIHQSMTVPISLKNAGYIIGDSFATGIPYGFSSGCNLYTIIKLQIDYRRYLFEDTNTIHQDLENDRLSINTNTQPLLSEHHFLANGNNPRLEMIAENPEEPEEPDESITENISPVQLQQKL